MRCAVAADKSDANELNVEVGQEAAVAFFTLVAGSASDGTEVI